MVQVSISLDCIGQCVEFGAILSALLYVVAGAWVVGELEQPGKAVEAVAHCDVDRLAKNPVSLFCVGLSKIISTTVGWIGSIASLNMR